MRWRIERCVVGIVLCVAACSRDRAEPPSADDPTAPAIIERAVAEVDAPADAEQSKPPPASCTSPCTVRTIAEGSSPHRVMIDDEHVYWLQESALHKAPRAGGPAIVLARDLETGDAALDRNAVIVCRRRADRELDVLRVSKDGSKTTTLGTATECTIGASAEHIYFPWRGAKRIALARVSDGGGRPEAIGASGSHPHVVVDGHHVVWSGDGAIRRLDERSGKVEEIVSEQERIDALTVTRTHIYFIRDSNAFRVAKDGPDRSIQRVANHQMAIDMANDGTRVYWTSVRDRRWVRYDPATESLEILPVADGAGWIAVDGSEVFFTVSGKPGGVQAIETCACTPLVLPRQPAIHDARAPEQEAVVRYGYADSTGRITVPVRDLSRDELDDTSELAFAESVALEDARVPGRFRTRRAFRITTTDGTFAAPLVDVGAGTCGEGTCFDLILQGPAEVRERVGLVTRDDGPPIGALREVTSDIEGVRKALKAIRAAADASGFGRRVGTKHVAAVRGAFPAPHVWLVHVAFPDPSADPDDEVGDDVHALLFTDAEGNITHEVFELAASDAIAIRYLVDVDEDGIDEVIFETSYHEGQYDHLLRWTAGAPEHDTIAGDGA